MSTPNSQSSSYLLPAEFSKRYDARTVGDLCSDNGTRVSASLLLTDSNLQAALDDASGMVESSCLAGQFYQPADLAGLTGVSQKLLYRIIADLAMGLLIERRPELKMEMPKGFDNALKWLDDLHEGKKIFSLVEVQKAGLPEVVQETFREVENRNLSTNICRRLFGRRANKYPENP